MPEISKGLATKVGLIGTALLAIVAAVQPFLEGDHSNDAEFWAALATATAVATILGRMLQGAAALRDAPSPMQVYEEPDFIEDVPEPVGTTHMPMPSEGELTADYGEDPPAGLSS